MKPRIVVLVASVFFALTLLSLPAQTQQNTHDAHDSNDDIRFTLYHTRPGDTLWKIAAAPEIYNDPWKWPLIYYYNQDVLKELGVPPTSLAIRALPPFSILAILPASEAARRLPGAHDSHHYWVLNVLSTPMTSEADQEVIRLIDAGYFAYLVHAVINQKRWHRVRVGFFPDKQSTQKAGTEMENRCGLKDYWSVMASRDEVREYWGYRENLE